MAHAQGEDPPLYKYGAKSPEAAEIEKYGTVPVGHYTGTPNVEIPLFTVEGRTLELPISLKYHGSGVKVTQEATWVGLGWSLNAGGAVTRQMKGRPDENGRLRPQDRDLYDKYQSRALPTTKYGFSGDSNDPETGEYYEEYYLHQISNGYWDAQPDRYTFSAPSLSGQFFIGEDATLSQYQTGALSTNDAGLYSIPRGPNRIEKRDGTGWVVTGADGKRYRFDEVEETSTRSETPKAGASVDWTNGLEYASAWHLGEIESAVGDDAIAFTYARPGTSTKRFISESISVGLESNGIENCSVSKTPSAHRSVHTSDRVLVESIQSAKHEAVFERSLGSSGWQLDAVKLYNAVTGELIKQADLEYGTFATTDGSTGRLRLERVVVHGGDRVDENVYAFDYNSEPLPPNDSHATDHWGYYNGANNGVGLADCGDTSPCQVPTFEANGITNDGADRSPHPDLMKAGILTAIQYPTGGRTELAYEPNATMVAVPVYDTITHTALATHTDAPNATVDVQTFDVQEGTYATIDPDVESDQRAFSCPVPAGGEPASVTLTQTDGGSTYEHWDEASLSQDPVEIWLDPGAYELKATAVCGVSLINVEWETQIGVQDEERLAGGLRVAKTLQYAHDGATPIEETYAYVDEEGVSSGSRFGLKPDYDFIKKTETQADDNSVETCETRVLSGNSGSAQLTSKGGHVAYSRVAVSRSDGSSTVHRFRVAGFGVPKDWPGAVASDLTYQGGQRIETTLHDDTGRVVQRTATPYEVDDPRVGVVVAQGINPLQDYTVRRSQGPGFPKVTHLDYVADENSIRTGWVHPQSETVTRYSAAGDEVWTETSYTYESTDVTHYQPVGETTRSSNAAPQTTTYQYAHEDPAYDGPSGMGPRGSNQVGAKSRISVTDSSGRVHKRSWTTYVDDGTGRWLTDETWVWDEQAPSSSAPEHPGGSGTVRTKSTPSFDAYGRPLEILDAYGESVNFTYGGTGAPGSPGDPGRDAYLTAVTKAELDASFAWGNTGRLVQRTDANGTTTSFAYDGLGRLEETTNDAGQTVATHDYHYVGPSGSPDTAPNFVRATAVGGASPDQVTTTYADGLGRTVQTHVRDSTDDVITAQGYDALGRPQTQYRPYVADVGHAYDPSGFTGQPASTTTYDADPRDRVDHVDPPGAGVVDKTYGMATVDPARFHGLTGTFAYVETTDESGDVTRTYTDALGQQVASVADPGGVDAVTRFEYDAAGSLTRVTKPEGDVVIYTYDRRGQLVERTSPDAGTTKTMYDAAGTARFVQNAVQRTRGRVQYTCVDALGRPTETSVVDLASLGAGSFEELAPSMLGGTGACAVVTSANTTLNAYDTKPDGAPWSTWAGASALPYNNVEGRLAATARRVKNSTLVLDGTVAGASETQTAPRRIETTRTLDLGANVTLKAGREIALRPGFEVQGQSEFTASIDSTLDTGSPDWRLTAYSYDGEGRVERKDVFAPDLGATTLTYAYDRQGRVRGRKVHLQALATTFCQWYVYTPRGRVDAVYAREDACDPAVRPTGLSPDVTYAYTADGQVKSTDWAGGPTIARSYTPRGWLQTIGDVAGASAPFNARYTYYADGSVDVAEFNQPQGPSAASRYRYEHAYDGLDRLTGATYSLYDNGWQATGTTGSFDVGGIDYDRNGNLTQLTRRDETGSIIDDLAYDYTQSSSVNRLDAITDAGGAVHAWDAGSGAFAYDAMGRMTDVGAAPYALSGITYNAQSLPVAMTLPSGEAVTYRYASSGDRTYAESPGTGSRHYVLDGAATVAVVEEGRLAYWNLTRPDGSVLGRLKQDGSVRYYLTDHLGSTRAVVDPAKPNGAKVVGTRDYYPFGLHMPGRIKQSSSEKTKEDFTGYEKDEETQLHYAGARYYSAAFGRFMTTDRFADKYPSLSPYQYAANNPSTLIDVNGDSVGVGAILTGPFAYHAVIVHVNEKTGERSNIAEGMPQHQGPLRAFASGSNGWGNLVAKQSTDPENLESSDIEKIKIPDGMTEEEFVGAIKEALGEYKDSKEKAKYDETPEGDEGEGNSNSLAGSVVREAGSDFDPTGWFPGWDINVLPSQQKEKNSEGDRNDNSKRREGEGKE